MSIIKVSIDKIYGILEPVDLELIKERVEVSNRMLSDGRKWAATWPKCWAANTTK